MPPGSEAEGSKKTAAAGGTDRLSTLPDELLQYLLSFLPSRDAVQTCVLAHRWRDQWKSVPALRITDVEHHRSASALNKFVNYLLPLRNRSPLREVVVNSYGGVDLDEAFKYLELWIRYGLSCEARVLRFCNNCKYRWWLPNGLITSKHLTVLELLYVKLEARILDFSSCPVLEDIRMKFCCVITNRIMSSSVKHLSITYSEFHWDVPLWISDMRTWISVPNLISLELAECQGRTPFLESMPLLVSAFVRLANSSDYCGNSYEIGDCGDDSCQGCPGSNDGNHTCVLLEGLSGATNLELTAQKEEFIFRKDLTRRCPVFSKLKTLLLNEWCITANLEPLICFLQHSPMLEKLTLQFSEDDEYIVETGASYDLVEQPVALKHLTVEIKCDKFDEKIGKIVEVLCSYGVPSKQVKIQQLPKIVKFQENGNWPSGIVSVMSRRQHSWDTDGSTIKSVS
ncbi:hypothetical protein ACP70R_004220 [Stipagrostis hirtigluma subsp. patula]